jgi:hypothetical protein
VVVVAPRCRHPVAGKSQGGRVIDEAPGPQPRHDRGVRSPKGAFVTFIELVQE